MMIIHADLTNTQLYSRIRARQIQLAGNKRLKIYGTLDCSSGKRMKKENRVFFKNETEALNQGFRPCGHCLVDEYKQWRS